MVNAVLMLGYKSYSFVVNNTRYNNDERQYIILDFGYGYIVVWQKRCFFPHFLIFWTYWVQHHYYFLNNLLVFFMASFDSIAEEWRDVMRKMGDDVQKRASGQVLNTGWLRWGHSLCTWAARSTSWATGAHRNVILKPYQSGLYNNNCQQCQLQCNLTNTCTWMFCPWPFMSDC